MKHRVTLTVTALLSVLLFTCHVADDIVRGFEKGNASNYPAMPMFALWMYGALVLAGRRSGYVIVLLGSLLSLAAPILHMRGRGVGGAIAESPGGFFFVFTILALGVLGLFTLVLSLQGLWSTIRRQSA